MTRQAIQGWRETALRAKVFLGIPALLGTATAAVFLASLSLGLAAPVDGAIDDSRPDKLELIRLIEGDRYDELERTIGGFQDGFEAGRRTQRALNTALYAFNYAAPHLEEKLGGWIAAHPESAFAYAARGIYRAHLGWIARGDRYMSKTTDVQIETMSRLFAGAERDLRTALEIDPRLAVPYVRLISIRKAVGNRRETRALMERALENLTDFYPAYYAYLYSLVPWWGGSLDAMAKFIQEIADRFPDDPRYRVTDARYREILAEKLSHDDDNQAAREQLDAAIEEERKTDYLLSRAYVLSYLDEDELALQDFMAVYDEFADNAEVLDKIGATYAALNRAGEAIRFKTMAVRLDPYNPDLLVSRAFTLRHFGRPAEAVADMQRLLVYGADNPEVHTRRGEFFGSRPNFNFPGWPGNVAMERDAYETAIEMEPDNPKNWLGYAHALFTQGECRARHVYAKFEELCEARGTCNDYGYTLDPRMMQSVGCKM